MTSSTITNTITNITKSNVILENPADWHEWMIVVNQSGEVEQLIDPDLTTEPILLEEPDRPKPSDKGRGYDYGSSYYRRKRRIPISERGLQD